MRTLLGSVGTLEQGQDTASSHPALKSAV